MRIWINYVVDVSDGFRRAVRHYYGRPGLATREDIKSWFEAYGDSMESSLRSEHEDCCFKGEP